MKLTDILWKNLYISSNATLNQKGPTAFKYKMFKRCSDALLPINPSIFKITTLIWTH